MPITPWYVSDQAPAWTITLNTDSGTTNLTGLTTSAFTAKIKNNATGVVSTGTGTFTIQQTNPGIIQYQTSSADVSTIGIYTVYVVVAFSNGPQTFLVERNWSIIPL